MFDHQDIKELQNINRALAHHSRLKFIRDFLKLVLIGFLLFRSVENEIIDLEKRKNKILKKIEKGVIQAKTEFNTKYTSEFYFSIQEFLIWKEKWKVLLYLKDIAIKNGDLRDSIAKIIDILQKEKDFIKKRNDRFIEQEIENYRDFFNSLESYVLTNNQKKAIIIDEKNNLVIAGAGTGKTTTLLGKAGYILKKGLAKPNDILLLSFGREAKKEIEDRVKKINENIDVRTFHSLGRQIIAEIEEKAPSISELSTDPLQLKLFKKIDDFIQRRIGFYQQHKIEDFVNGEKVPFDLDRKGKFLELLNKYFLFNLRPYKSIFNFSSFGEYIKHIKENNIRSLNGDLVKSYEECEIANFLYMNGINYLYEKDYEIDTSTQQYGQYRPDFYLPDYRLYIEHFGIDREGNTASFFDREKYHEKMLWKRNIHDENDTKLIETYSYEKWEKSLLLNLEKSLKKEGVKFNPLTKEEIFTKINEMGKVEPFIKLLTKFLNLFKSSNLTLPKIREKAKQSPDSERYEVFLYIFSKIYSDYTEYLEKTHKIDFHDMINRAEKYVSKGKYKKKLKYILIDEFQDISQSRYRFIKSILKENPSCKTYCVGDDWQSIYRFTGSDLSIMTNFEKFFGITESMYLDETFRFNNQICDFSSNFIMKNPDQIPKKMNTNPATNSDLPSVTIVWIKPNIEQTLIKILNQISQSNRKKISIFILGRYRNQKLQNIRELEKEFPAISLKYYTAHSSKGKEADYVIILGLQSGRNIYGFPCQIEDDPILNLVLAEEDTYPNSEERRLFYVALTRAKKQVYLLTDERFPSSFITEILQENYEYNIYGKKDRINKICPFCKTGFIIPRKGNWGLFYSCSNYPYCQYKEN